MWTTYFECVFESKNDFHERFPQLSKRKRKRKNDLHANSQSHVAHPQTHQNIKSSPHCHRWQHTYINNYNHKTAPSTHTLRHSHTVNEYRQIAVSLSSERIMENGTVQCCVLHHSAQVYMPLLHTTVASHYVPLG